MNPLKFKERTVQRCDCTWACVEPWKTKQALWNPTLEIDHRTCGLPTWREHSTNKHALHPLLNLSSWLNVEIFGLNIAFRKVQWSLASPELQGDDCLNIHCITLSCDYSENALLCGFAARDEGETCLCRTPSIVNEANGIVIGLPCTFKFLKYERAPVGCQRNTVSTKTITCTKGMWQTWWQFASVSRRFHFSYSTGFE